MDQTVDFPPLIIANNRYKYAKLVMADIMMIIYKCDEY